MWSRRVTSGQPGFLHAAPGSCSLCPETFRQTLSWPFMSLALKSCSITSPASHWPRKLQSSAYFPGKETQTPTSWWNDAKVAVHKRNAGLKLYLYTHLWQVTINHISQAHNLLSFQILFPLLTIFLYFSIPFSPVWFSYSHFSPGFTSLPPIPKLKLRTFFSHFWIALDAFYLWSKIHWARQPLNQMILLLQL